jgi:hypothetical protein
MSEWMDESMRTKTAASDYSFVSCSASFKAKRASRAQLCSVQCRYPRGRRRRSREAAAVRAVFESFSSAAVPVFE